MYEHTHDYKEKAFSKSVHSRVTIMTLKGRPHSQLAYRITQCKIDNPRDSTKATNNPPVFHASRVPEHQLHAFKEIMSSNLLKNPHDAYMHIPSPKTILQQMKTSLAHNTPKRCCFPQIIHQLINTM